MADTLSDFCRLQGNIKFFQNHFKLFINSRLSNSCNVKARRTWSSFRSFPYPRIILIFYSSVKGLFDLSILIRAIFFNQNMKCPFKLVNLPDFLTQFCAFVNKMIANKKYQLKRNTLKLWKKEKNKYKNRCILMLEVWRNIKCCVESSLFKRLVSKSKRSFPISSLLSFFASRS